jgi:ABC-type bacteriocin/lantibiotic exporter with double-glycine peptidase domain
MNLDQIISVHQFFVQAYGVQANFTPLRKKAKSVTGYTDANLDNFTDTLVDTGRQVHLAYLSKSISWENIQYSLFEENLSLLIFCNKSNTHVPVICDVIDGIFKTNEIDAKGNVVTSTRDFQEWKEEISTLIQHDEQGLISVMIGFPHESPSGSEKAMHNHKPTINAVIMRFFGLLVSEKKEIGHLYIYAFLSGFISLSLPLGIQSIINFVSSGQITTSVIVLISLIVIGTMVSGGLQIMQLYLVEYIQKRIFAKTAFEFTLRVPRLKVESILKEYPPELMNRFFDVVSVQKGMAKILIDFSAAILQITFGMILLTLYHPAFILLGFLLLIMIVLVIRFTSAEGIYTSLNESKYKYQLAHWLEEISRALSTFKLAGYTNLAIDKTDSILSSYLQARRAHFKVLVIQYSAFTIFKTLITAGLLILGSYLLIQREINLGQFVASEIVIILVMSATEKIIMQLETVYDVLTSSEKIGLISDLPLEENTGLISLPTEENKGLEIEVKDLYYRYTSNDRDVLKNVNLKINHSERVCLTGYKKSGKKTLINIILGMLHNYKGVIAINGLSYRDINRNNLISYIGDNIAQEDIFDGTILENITLGRSNLSIDAVRFAIDKAGLTEYVLSLHDGLNHHLKKELGSLPSVITNKIILARSIVHKPKLLLLEDVFDGIKKEERDRIMNFIFDASQSWTVVLMTEDEELMKRCNQVLVMKEGQIAYAGPFDSQYLKFNV